MWCDSHLDMVLKTYNVNFYIHVHTVWSKHYNRLLTLILQHHFRPITKCLVSKVYFETQIHVLEIWLAPWILKQIKFLVAIFKSAS